MSPAPGPSSLASVVDALLAVLLPPRCGVCGEPQAVRPRHGACARCLEHAAANDGPRCPRCDLPGHDAPCAGCSASPPPFSKLWAPWLYGGAVADLVVAVKFHGREDLGGGLGRLLADEPCAREALEGAQALVPVPLGARRRRQRGFNQSAVLARVLSREHHVPVLHALTRRRETRAQSYLGLTDRRANVDGAFGARKRVSGICVLVDDVVTSGETARNAAAALLEAGAREVRVLAVARTPPGAA